ncbi:glycoside hydrolase family 127 protein [Parabacteroides sp. Marseille-P3160]|uniref:glycoside hydrolase family 127 protein n=1 Tax=Parabacteroides sp. Marseille-P3160 TaxID=1917887 RepID=UPI0009BABF20|nr:beta-L-arabinofuranosidase domain-containing protein [Parabacteroides sp. Marseille-P3160]
MKKNHFVRNISFLLFCIPFIVWGQTLQHIELSGYLGRSVDNCIEHRVKAQDVDHLVEPFRHKEETSRWQSEFWGKWVQGAIASYRYNKDPELYKIISESVESLLKTQLPNGYIGNYSEAAQLQQWDVWGRKYTALGLIAYADLSGDKKALDAACRMIDHLMTQVGPGKVNIVTTGNYIGMASSSILEPVMYLYNRTKEEKYLNFAQYIVAQWETPEGPQLISKAIADVPVSQRFPHPKIWFSRENGQKAYEMMSCYEGLLELYKVTKNPLYLSVVEKTVNHIINEEINIAGSGSAFECWYGGNNRQTIPTYHMMETCVTFTWMQICNRLLELTGNSLYADQIEKTIYNALLASMKSDASQIAKYSPLEGWRHEGEEQCGMHINCCNANGPRAFALIPAFAYQVKDDAVRVNLYAPSTVDIQLANKRKVQLRQQTDYPVKDQIAIEVNPEKATEFSLLLRIPAWSRQVSVAVNGEAQTGCLQGSYYTLRRKWNPGDQVVLTLDLRAHVVELNQAQAIVRGPIVLARDSRFGDGDVDEASVIVQKEGYVDLQPSAASDFAWMAFTVPMVLGTDLEGNRDPKPIHFCDFASAGNTWNKAERYRVWLPKTLNVMHSPYKPY